MNSDYPEHLRINGRSALPNAEFCDGDLLYRSYDYDDIAPDGNIGIHSIETTDMSCHWGRFSFVEDMRHRTNARKTDGVYSITVETARFKGIATPVHVPLREPAYENYAHTEIRFLKDSEDALTTPRPERRLRAKKDKKRKMLYRHNLVTNLKIELRATS